MCMRAQLPQLHNLEGDCVFLFYSFILYYFILFGRKVTLAAECVGNEEINHLAMMITSFLQEGAGVFVFYQNCNIECRFTSVALEHYPSTYIQKGDETWSIISVMKPQRTGSSVQSAN